MTDKYEAAFGAGPRRGGFLFATEHRSGPIEEKVSNRMNPGKYFAYIENKRIILGLKTCKEAGMWH